MALPNYGTDLSCVTDLDPSGAEVSGRLLLGQAIARRLITPRGRLIDDANYGFDLRQFIDDDLGPADIARIQSGIQTECQKDERVLSAIATVVYSAGTLLVTVQIQDGAGPFNLVLAVSSVTAALLSVGQ